MIEKIGLVIPVYKRPEYVSQCLDSLRNAKTMPNSIILVDDNGEDAEVNMLMDNFIKDMDPIAHLISKKQNEGVRYALKDGIERAFELGCDTIINLDSDAIVKPDFIDVLIGLLRMHNGQNIVSGFNCISDYNPILSQFDNFAHKDLCNGINMCFTRAQYEKYIAENLLINDNWDRRTSYACKADGRPFIITTPSVVQHVGMKSSMGHDRFGPADVAIDF